MLKYKGYGLSDKGRVRENNEDCFAIDNDLGLYVVCDGLGGHNSGEVASLTACEKIRDFIRSNPAAIQQYNATPSRQNRESVGQLLAVALQAGNTAILELAKTQPKNEGMATTAEVLLLLRDYALIGHVGDSRSYLIRGDSAHLLSEDHSFGNEMIKKGAWDTATAEKSPYRTNLTRALGAQPAVQADILQIELSQGDIFVLCTDGLHAYLKPSDFHRFAVQKPASELAAQLIREALRQGGHDNTTAVTVKVEQLAHSPEMTKPITDAPRKQQAIGKVPLFAYLTFAEINKVQALSSTATLQPGEILCREGENPEQMYILVSGEASVIKGGQVIATLRSGASVGEMGIIDNLPRSATVQAKEALTFLCIEKRDFIQFLKQDPALAVKVLWAMGLELDRRLRSTSRDLAEARNLLEKSKKSALPFDLR